LYAHRDGVGVNVSPDAWGNLRVDPKGAAMNFGVDAGAMVRSVTGLQTNDPGAMNTLVGQEDPIDKHLLGPSPNELLGAVALPAAIVFAAVVVFLGLRKRGE